MKKFKEIVIAFIIYFIILYIIGVYNGASLNPMLWSN